jgi:outer membrane protein OmpA-like peptidoglycan-associated protein
MLALLSAVAFAQDAVTVSTVRYAQEGLSTPSISFHSNVSGNLSAHLGCGASPFDVSGAISPGDTLTIDLKGLPRGSTSCAGTLTLHASDGTSGQMPLSLTVQVLPAVKLDVKPADLDLKRHHLIVHGDRQLTAASVDVYGEKGKLVGHGEVAGLAPADSIDLQWSGDGEAIKLEVTAKDAHDLPGQLELQPWSYDIPHEDVVFASNQSTIDASELPKLESAWPQLQGVPDKYGDVVEVRLYVGGYTDTVGTPDHNLALSNDRAKAIATWFRTRGFKGPVSYQGFGEAALAVSTPDQTDEPKNRRALYILAAQQPSLSTELPTANWRSL